MYAIQFLVFIAYQQKWGSSQTAQLHKLKATVTVFIQELAYLIRTCGSNSGDSDQAAHVHGLIIGSVAHVRQLRLSTSLLRACE